MQKNDPKPMVSVKVNEKEVRKLYLKELEKKIEQIDMELLFWDTNENPRFPKEKLVGSGISMQRRQKNFCYIVSRTGDR